MLEQRRPPPSEVQALGNKEAFDSSTRDLTRLAGIFLTALRKSCGM
jgi:hypothetical protein